MCARIESDEKPDLPFLQRGREAQRCQVTPYVVNVVLLLLLEGSDS